MSSFNLYPDPFQSFPNLSPTAPSALAPDLGDEPQPKINWTNRLQNYEHVFNALPASKKARIMRPVGAALSALAVAFAKVTLHASLTMTATPFVVLGSVAALSLLTLTTAGIGIYLLIFRAYTHTPQVRIAKEQKIVEEIQSNPELTWAEVQAKFPNGRSPFCPVELDIIYFRQQVDSLTAKAFIDTNDAINELTPARKAILADKFLREIAQEKRGLLDLMGSYSKYLEALGIQKCDVWESIRDNEVAQSFTAFKTRNGTEVLNELTAPQIQAVGNSLLNEIPARKIIYGYRETLKFAKTLNIEDKCKQKFAEWFAVNKVGNNLQKLVTAYGLDVVDPIFIPEKNDPVIAEFIGSCDFNGDYAAIMALLEKNMLADASKAALIARFKAQMKAKKNSWNDIKACYPTFVKTQGITLESIMPFIEEHEVSLGYLNFRLRNGADAFKYLTPQSKQSLQESFLSQVTFQNLDQSLSLPEGSNELAITLQMIEARRGQWFKDQLAKIHNPTVQSLVKQFGSSVISEQYLPANESTDIVRRSLASMVFGADDIVINKLVLDCYLNDDQCLHLKNSRQEIESLRAHRTEASKAAESVHIDAVAKVEGEYASFLTQATQQEQAINAQFNLSMSQIDHAIATNKALLKELEGHQNAYGRELAAKNSKIQSLNTERSALHASITQAEHDLSSDAIAQARAKITTIESQLQQIPSIPDQSTQIQRIREDLTTIRTRLNGIRNAADTLRAKLGERAATAATDDLSVTRAVLEEQRRTSARITNVGSAFVAALPGSDHARKLKELDDKIAVKLKLEVLNQEILRLESYPKEADPKDLAKESELLEKLGNLEREQTVRLDNDRQRSRLNEALAAQKAIIEKHEKLPEKIAAMKYQYVVKENECAALLKGVEDLCNQQTIARGKLTSVAQQLQQQESQRAVQATMRTSALASINAGREQLNAQKLDKIKKLVEEYQTTAHTINLTYNAKVAKVCEDFRVKYA